MKEGIFKKNELTIIVSVDAGFWHLSISHPKRYPTFDEVRDVRYEYLPDNITVAMMYPPKAEYVNVHPNCFHLWQIKDRDTVGGGVLKELKDELTPDELGIPFCGGCGSDKPFLLSKEDTNDVVATYKCPSCGAIELMKRK